MKDFKAIEEAKKILSANGYFTDNLWSINDVKSKFDCSDEEAHVVLFHSLTNEATMEQIWFSIQEFGNDLKLTDISDN